MGVLKVVSELSQPTGLCTEPEIVSSTWADFCILQREKIWLIREEEKKMKSCIILMVLY